MANNATPSGEISVAESTEDTVVYTPRADLYETENELVVQFDIPGGKVDDIDLQFERGVLTLHGKTASRTRSADLVASEYGVGDFHRSFSIPVDVDATKFAADSHLGVLTVHLTNA